MENIDNIETVSTEETTATVAKPSKGARFKRAIKNFFTYNIEGKRPRIWELDLIRGIIMLVVTLDHVCRFSYYWGIIHFKTAFGQAIERAVDAYFNSGICDNVYPYGLWALCFMSGISCQFSRSSVSRLIKFWALTVVIMGGYLALHFIIPDLITGYVIFNIVAVLAISITFWYVLDKLKIPDLYRIIIGALVAVAGVTLFYCNKYIDGGIFIKNDFLALLIYNVNGYNVSSNNFEPLIPHLGFFILGGVFGKHFYRDKTTKLKREAPPKWLSPVMLLGKHSLVAYLFLPTLCIGVLWLVVNFIGLFL